MSTAPACLNHSRVTITPALRAGADRPDRRSRHQAAYHFGWITADVTPNSLLGKAQS